MIDYHTQWYLFVDLKGRKNLHFKQMDVFLVVTYDIKDTC